MIGEDYSRRVLTCSSDRLLAISGIARLIHKQINSSYLAGLWLRDIAYGLGWQHKNPAALPRRVCHMWPSWSWVSHDFQVSWGRKYHDKTLITLKSYGLGLETSDPFGHVSSGWLKVSGNLVELQVHYDSDAKHSTDGTLRLPNHAEHRGSVRQDSKEL
jgi:hypothetical protein